MPTIEERYRAALAAIPAPGGGGCHAALLGVANLGIMAGSNDGAILSDIRAHIPAGWRKVADREIMDAINRAHKDTAPLDHNAPRPRPIPPPRRSYAENVAAMLKDPAKVAELLAFVTNAGGGELDPEGADVWEASPIRINAYSEHFPYAGDMLALLETLYQPDDVLFIGSRYDAGRENIKTAKEWITFFRRSLAWIAKQPADNQQGCFDRLGIKYPQIIPNPLTGQPGAKIIGGDTLRGTNCVKFFRYIVAEFDGLPMLQQGAILRGLCAQGLKIAALIHSGGKSCHAWIVCDHVASVDDWRHNVKENLFPLLVAFGIDRACSDAGRQSRLPGVFRTDKKNGTQTRRNWQRLLYLAPGGGTL